MGNLLSWEDRLAVLAGQDRVELDSVKTHAPFAESVERDCGVVTTVEFLDLPCATTVGGKKRWLRCRCGAAEMRLGHLDGVGVPRVLPLEKQEQDRLLPGASSFSRSSDQSRRRAAYALSQQVAPSPQAY
jgi:hypothetical protein